MRTIVVVTVARSDWGLYLPILRRLREAPDVRLRLIVSGTHLSPQFGRTERVILEDGFSIDRRVEITLASDSPLGVASTMGLATTGFAQAYTDLAPDLLLLLGDRSEMHAAGCAAVPFGIPIAHIHGGEVTEGAIDDVFRHSLTKMSHLHFATTAEHGRRIAQMGEEPWRIHVVGAPSLDNLGTMNLMDPDEIRSTYGLDVSRKPLLVTFHPVTLDFERTEEQVDGLLEALHAARLPVVFTMPNADTRNSVIRARIEAFVATHRDARAFESLGTRGYWSIMRHAAAMVGNSSSGIIEAASFGLPVVNVGNRQKGRLRGPNVIDVDYDASSILKAIREATDPAFAAQLRGTPNPYGDGQSAGRIVKILRTVPIDRSLRVKRFRDAGESP